MKGQARYALLLAILPFLPLALKTALEARPLLSSQTSTQTSEKAEVRTQLLIGLDLLVRAELGLKQELSEFSRSLERVPEVLGGLTYFYRVEITKATRDRLVVMAFADGRRASETAGIVGDRVAIDERFRVLANFPLPEPPKEYLRVLAQTVLNRITQADFMIPSRGELDLLEGVFQDYFRYEVRPTSQGGKAAVAIGVRAPVKGESVEVQKGADLFEWAYNNRHTKWLDQEVFGQLEKIHMAERIHQHHAGAFTDRYDALKTIWSSVTAKRGVSSAMEVEDLSEDPTFGYRAELTFRNRPQSDSPQRTPASKARTWVINGFGQISEVSPIESVVQKFEETHRRISVHGDVQPNYETGSSAEKSKPLIIDAVEGEK